MNRKGFTLVELLATLVVLAIIMGIVLISTTQGMNKAKKGTEDIFIKMIQDAMDIYLDTDAKKLKYTEQCGSMINKKQPGTDDTRTVKVYKANKSINIYDDIINSEYHPISEKDMHNPARKGDANYNCVNLNRITIDVYRDEDYVYYYSIDKANFNCLSDDNKEGAITNLPSGFSCNS